MIKIILNAEKSPEIKILFEKIETEAGSFLVLIISPNYHVHDSFLSA